MARKTNYAFDRNNRAKAKAAKREAKRQAKLAAKEQKMGATSVEGMAEDSPAEGSEEIQDNRADGVSPPENS
ncbi:MAG: hypothetical protein GWP69_19135 [Gammaproteobacteria bacterium]|jgi:hypothetical protein|nr:hypothetical protein [Gammaproteobacteria bacterium]NCF80027.1 hypothetical protein [Pseudomonadota bacterium]